MFYCNKTNNLNKNNSSKKINQLLIEPTTEHAQLTKNKKKNNKNMVRINSTWYTNKQ